MSDFKQALMLLVLWLVMEKTLGVPRECPAGMYFDKHLGQMGRCASCYELCDQFRDPDCPTKCPDYLKTQTTDSASTPEPSTLAPKAGMSQVSSADDDPSRSILLYTFGPLSAVALLVVVALLVFVVVVPKVRSARKRREGFAGNQGSAHQPGDVEMQLLNGHLVDPPLVDTHHQNGLPASQQDAFQTAHQDRRPIPVSGEDESRTVSISQAVSFRPPRP